jgi:hypothetical protein
VAYERFHSGLKSPHTRALVALVAIAHRHPTPHSLRWMRRSLVPADSWPKPMPKLQRAQTVGEFGASSLEERRRPVVAHRQTPKHDDPKEIIMALNPHLHGLVIQAHADTNGIPPERPCLRIVVNNEFAGGCTP